MLTLRSGSYHKSDYDFLYDMLKFSEVFRRNNFCYQYSDCSTCPVRHVCADLSRLGLHLEQQTNVPVDNSVECV